MKSPLALSTICISLAFAPMAAAQSFPTGCFVRAYTQEHLASHPEQGVAEVQMRFDDRDLSLTIMARMGRGGQAARDGARGLDLMEFATCDSSGRCNIPCDGGIVWLHRNEGDSILVRTRGARLATEACNTTLPFSDLAENRGQITTYRLYRANAAACTVPVAVTPEPAATDATPDPAPAVDPTPQPTVTIDP